nr:ribonuclease H-like domain-containing protein [Tanacetum cinerariifolium]
DCMAGISSCTITTGDLFCLDDLEEAFDPSPKSGCFFCLKLSSLLAFDPFPKTQGKNQDLLLLLLARTKEDNDGLRKDKIQVQIKLVVQIFGFLDSFLEEAVLIRRFRIGSVMFDAIRKELRCRVQCLIEGEDFVKRLRLLSTVEVTAADMEVTTVGSGFYYWLRIKQYFQVQDYALWDVIENENSFISAAQTTTNADGTSTTLIPGPVTTEEKVQKKNDVKERSMLLMALPNEHLMTFNQYKEAKTLFAAIQTRFGGSQIPDNSRKSVGFVSYNAVPPPPTGLFSPPKLDLSNSGLEEFQQPEFEGYGPKTSNSVSEDISNEGNPQLELQEKGVIDSGRSRHMTGIMSYLFEYEEIDGGYVAFGGDPKRGKIPTNIKINMADVIGLNKSTTSPMYFEP